MVSDQRCSPVPEPANTSLTRSKTIHDPPDLIKISYPSWQRTPYIAPHSLPSHCFNSSRQAPHMRSKRVPALHSWVCAQETELLPCSLCLFPLALLSFRSYSAEEFLVLFCFVYNPRATHIFWYDSYFVISFLLIFCLRFLHHHWI